MKKKYLVSVLLVCTGLLSCSDDNEVAKGTEERVSTYMSVSVNLPSKQLSKATGDNVDNNLDGTYEGNDIIKTLDVYMQDAGGNIEQIRFESSDIAISNGATGTVVSPSSPFLTTSGQKTIYIVLNDTENLGSSFGPGSEGNMVNTTNLATIESGKDVIVMTGKNTINVAPSVSMQQAADGNNRIAVDVTRVVSRVIVTHTLDDMAFNDGNGHTGTLSDLQYSVAQGTNMIYWLAPSGADIYSTYGYEYVPKINVNGNVSYPGSEYAIKYYNYSDLSTPAEIPVKPTAADEYKSLTGKFLFENTHKFGTTGEATGYRKGNTAYVLVKVKFTPDAASIADGGTLTSGTFYVGASDGKIYSSRSKADEAVANQKVRTYLNGKMLYFAWLNPDNITQPMNSPVLRNNIYHINVRSFSLLGETWNPLYPEDPDTASPQNPDPKPNPEEPGNAVDPYDPLYIEKTYMTIDASVLDWTANSYDIDF